jgi:alanyl-tRNA synthetase
MTTNEVRKRFLDFAKQNGHAVIASSALVPENDPTTLFTGSGMQPMVPYLLGQKHPLGDKIADSQKCFRSQDIEEVGDNRHTTFFEMLGNWSLGAYFKETQIPFMWSFLIDEVKLDANRFYISCFKGSPELQIPKDTESADLWKALFASKQIEAEVGDNPEIDGLVEGQRIFYYGEKKNWWSRAGVPQNMPVGEPGGPDTEMFYDFYPELGRACIPNTPWTGEFCHVNCDCGRFIEIGNNVFMEYVNTEAGFEKLTQQNVDFGGGLERIVAAVRNDADVFNIDVFDAPKQSIEKLSGKKYEGDNVYAYRVILDHLRAATFLVGDGVLPGNKDQMYFVRRLIRRAVRFARNLGIQENFTKEVVASYIEVYGNEYGNLLEKREAIISAIDTEESKFRKTLENGIKLFKKEILFAYSGTRGIPNDLEKAERYVAPNTVFNLVTSEGFPIELLEEMAKEEGYLISMDDFNNRMKEHKELSRTASAGKFKGGLGGDGEMEIKYHTATHILHQALKTVLGESVEQKGSNITSERLRFDFAYDRKMTDEEKKQVEDIVNQNIQKDLPMIREEVSFDEAVARGAIGLFGDKYGDTVSIYYMGTNGTKRGDEGLFSIEFCGGPHVERTGVLGKFTIQKEEAVSAGVRRIKAVLV